MASQSSGISAARRAATVALASGALLAGVVGFGTAAAWAEPTPTPGDGSESSADGAPAQEMTADQALAIIANEYDTGAGGGKVSVLIHNILQLRAQGFMPSQGNREAIIAALDKRPNQVPLVKALESTYAFQLRNQTRAAAANTGQQQMINVGGGNIGQTMNPNQGGINIPIG